MGNKYISQYTMVVLIDTSLKQNTQIYPFGHGISEGGSRGEQSSI